MGLFFCWESPQQGVANGLGDFDLFAPGLPEKDLAEEGYGIGHVAQPGV